MVKFDNIQKLLHEINVFDNLQRNIIKNNPEWKVDWNSFFGSIEKENLLELMKECNDHTRGIFCYYLVKSYDVNLIKKIVQNNPEFMVRFDWDPKFKPNVEL